jgi:uncharacterized radical SAM superfamily Fe-S cluster-containing enzyme
LKGLLIPRILVSNINASIESDCACPDDGLAPTLHWALCASVAESDCACPDDGFAPNSARVLNETISWQAAPALYRAPLPNDHEVAFNPLGAVGVTVLNAPARRILDAFAQPRTLPQAIAALNSMAPANVLRASHDLAALGLLQPAGVVSTFTRAQPRTLIAWLHITNACNLRCAYCYVNKTNEAMDESTGIAAVEAVFRSALTHQFRAVKLKYAGGEPSLNCRSRADTPRTRAPSCRCVRAGIARGTLEQRRHTHRYNA